jgi:amino acid adenylation domain-containing protein
VSALPVEEFVSELRRRDVKLWREGTELRCNAPRGVLTSELREELARRKAEILAALARAELAAGPVPLPREARLPGARFPLSFSQERLWFLNQFYADASAYNLQMLVPRAGTAAAVRAALEELVRRHVMLRTVYENSEDGPVQLIRPPGQIELRVLDLSALDEAGYREAVGRYGREDMQQPFALATGPVWRATLCQQRDGQGDLVFTVHHIAADGWSLNLLRAELRELCRAVAAGESPGLPAPPIDYLDYVRWQRQWLDAARLEEQLGYWRKQLAGAPPVIELPADRPRPPVYTYRGAACAGSVEGPVVDQLRAIARQGQATLFMTLLATFDVLLSRYSRQEDIVVGTPILGRQHPHTEAVVGLFLNTLVLRTDLSGEPTFNELLARVRATALGAFERQDTPFEKIVEALKPPRDASRNPLFQVMFTYLLPTGEAAGEGAGEAIESLGAAGAQVDLALYVQEHAGRLDLALAYSTDLFDAETARQMLRHYRRLLFAVAAQPNAGIGKLPLLDDMERRQVLNEWNDTRTGRAGTARTDRMIAVQCQRRPGAVAVEFEGESLNYGELDQRAERLARHLCGLGVGPGTLVGVFMERSIEMVVALYSIMKAGGAYLPLDPEYPAERLAFMMQDAAAPVLLTQRRLAGRLPPHQAAVVCLDWPWDGIAEHDGGPPVDVDGAELAYVIYTSGSTGRPKGVQVRHRGLANFLNSMARVPGMTDQDVLVAVTTLSFDIAALELYLPLVRGARLVLASRSTAMDGVALTALMNRSGATVMQATPATWRLLLAAGWTGSAALTALCGGEALTRDLADALLPRCKALWNLYGPTETTVWATVHRVTSGDGSIPIGRPIDNTRVYVLDPQGQPVPIGVAGELHIGGVQVAAGYLHRPDLTADRFVTDPFADEVDARMYRTGDLGRHRRDGSVEFLGRMDGQVKLRGFRIELGEIEAVLGRHPSVRTAVVSLRHLASGDPGLVAYVIAAGEETPAVTDLAAYAAQFLPAYMVPAAFVFLDALPLTPSGKVDRKALPEPQAGAQRAVAYVAPQGEIEESLARIWSELLGMPRIGAHDNFFALGGHSLLATRLVSRVRDQLSVELPVVRVFDTPDLAALAGVIEQLMAGRRATMAGQGATMAGQGAVTTGVTRYAGSEPAPLSSAQLRFWILEQMEPGSTAHHIAGACRLTGAWQPALLREALGQLVRRHEALRTTFPARDGAPVQLVSARVCAELPCEDVAACDEATWLDVVRRRAREESHWPMDLANGPLMRARLLRRGDNEHALIVVIHHIVSDGWSLGVLLREWVMAYRDLARGEPVSLPELPVRYTDYARWQQEWMRSEVCSAQLGYWRRQLDGIATLDLPTVRSRPPIQTFTGRTYLSRLAPAVSEEVRSLARKHGVSLFIALLALFKLLLFRLSQQRDIAVGTPVAGRGRSELEGLVGLFINTLVLRTRIDGQAGFGQLLARVRETALGAYAHQDLPFEHLVEALNPPRDRSRNPLFQVMFRLNERPPFEPLQLSGLSAAPLAYDDETAALDLSVSVTDSDGGLAVEWNYNTALYDAAAITGMAGCFARLIESAVTDPQGAIAGLPILPGDERERILVSWNRTGRDWPVLPVSQLVEAQVARTPTATAVVFERAASSYAEMNAGANRLARHLRALGVHANARVGVCLERGTEMLVAVLAVLKAGGGYVPLDPGYPAERLRFMIEDSEAAVLLTDSALLPRLGPLACAVVCLDRDRAAIEAHDGSNLEVTAAPEDLAYLIYTSGSTGQPKGVEVPNGALVNFLHSMAERLGIGAKDVLVAVTTLSFDIAGLELYLPLMRGARLVIASRAAATDGAALAALLQDSGATFLQATPATWRLLLAAGWTGSPELTALCGGEALPRDLAEALLGRCAALWNMYGPTETTIWSTMLQVVPGDGPVSIGRPIANTQIYITDPMMQPVPVGVAGELLIGGAGVARGYWRRPELTAERFIPDPFSARHGARLYRTGDLARWRADGTIEYLGRMDNQVKLRGFRIELGEIEAALASHASIGQVVVAMREDKPGDQRLVAYAVPRAGQSPAIEELRQHVAASLPSHMVPATVVFLDALPLTPNGKIDRKALPAPVRATARRPAAPPQPASETERIMADIWKELLDVDQVHATDMFFDLGGHSLLAVQAVQRFEQETGLRVGPADLINQSLRQITAGLGERRKPRAPDESPARGARLAGLLGNRP